MDQPAKALEAYEANLRKHPNRFNALYGAAIAAEKSGKVQIATSYFRQLAKLAGDGPSKRRELKEASHFLQASNIE